MRKFLLLSFIACAVIDLNAQIVYTDIFPDDTLDTGDMYGLDLNNDGTTDFTIEIVYERLSCGCNTFDHNKVLMSPLNSNEIIGIASGVKPLNNNDTIGPNQVWHTFAPQIIHTNTITCHPMAPVCINIDGYGHPWPYLTNAYAGLRVSIGSQFIYGWFRISLDDWRSPGAVIKDYAFNTIPDSMLFAGSGFTSLEHLELNSNISISPNPAHDKLNVECNLPNGSTGSPTAELKIYDVTGREVYSTTLHAKHETLNLSLSPALYFVRVASSTSATAVQKLIVE